MPAVGASVGASSRPAVAPSVLRSSRVCSVRGVSGRVSSGSCVVSLSRGVSVARLSSRGVSVGAMSSSSARSVAAAAASGGRARRSFAVRATSGGHLAETSVSPGGYSRTATVGVLGGGQLGQMLGQEAVKLGVRLVALDPNPRCPASLDCEVITGSFRDPASVWKLAESVDVLTVEIEHVDASALQKVCDSRVADVQPAPEAIAIIQDKFAQKEHLARAGVAVADFMSVSSAEEAQAAGRAFGFPLLLKARKLAYDGKGNAVVRAADDLDAAARSLGGYKVGLYAERFVPFSRELAVMVARNRDGTLTVFPATQTRHENNICVTTETPAAVPPAVRRAAADLARQAVATLPGAGIFGVELFVGKERREKTKTAATTRLPGASGASGAAAVPTLLVNEIAPRPHNSGHYTIEACHTSQYEAHLRAVLGWPAGDPSLKVGASIMLNVLGRAEGDEGLRIAHETLGRALATPGATPHWYGKEGCSVGRKIGHVTIVGTSLRDVRDKLRKIDPEAADRLERESPIEQGADVPDDGEELARGAGTVQAETAQAPVSTSSAAPVSASPCASSSSSSPSETFASPAPPVGIIMGSDSDLSAMRNAAQALKDLGIECEVTIVSAHRTPARMAEYARTARARGVKVIIAGAGGAAHLPGMVAAQTDLPVIGVPVVPNGSRLDGLDALLSIVQMPKGVPVATVGIHNAANAGLLAARILGAADPEIGAKMKAFMEKQEQVVLDKAKKLEGGWENYQV